MQADTSGRRPRALTAAGAWLLLMAAAAMPEPAWAAEDDTFTVEFNSTNNVLNVLANDGVTGSAFIVTVGTPDQGGTATVPEGRRRIIYTPPAGFRGVERFSYTVLSGVSFSGAEVTVQVGRPNDAPAAADDNYAAVENTPLDVGAAEGVLANDSDPDGDPLTAVLVDGPTNGSLTLNADGSFTYTPRAGFSGEDGFTYRADDGIEASDTATVTLTVQDSRADLRLTMTAAPNPVGTRATAAWTLTITNAGNTQADSPLLEGSFTGTVPFAFDGADEPACTLEPDGNGTRVSCPLDPLPAGESVTLELTGSGTQAGDVLGRAQAVAEGAIEETPADNEAAASLSIAAEISSESAQTLEGFAALGLAAADLDGDGHTDLAVATPADAAVLVFLNTPAPGNDSKRLLSEQAVSVGTDAHDNAIALGDLDGDDDVDIVAAGAPGHPLRVFLNDGTAQFEAFEIGDGADDTRAVALGDVDGDGFTDLVLANAGPNAVYLSLGVAGEYAEPIRFGDSDSAGVAVADLFGDTRPEIVIAEADGDARIYALADGAAAQALSLPTGATTSVAAVDVDADGATDLLFGRDEAAAPDGMPSNPYYSNTSGSSPAFFGADELGAAPTVLILTDDADADGDADAIVLNRTGAHQVFANTQSASNAFLLAPTQIAAPQVGAAALGHFNADARRDLALGGADGVALFFNDGSGRYGLGDVDGPTIELNGEPSVTLDVGANYDDAGATATDAVDGDLTDEIVVDNPVDTAVVGTYVVSYNVTDSSGNRADTATRSVEIRAQQGAGGGGGGVAGWGALALLLAAAGARALTARRRARRSGP